MNRSPFHDAPDTLAAKLFEAVSNHYVHADGSGMTVDADELALAMVAVTAFIVSMIPAMRTARAQREFADWTAREMKALLKSASADHEVSGIDGAVTAHVKPQERPLSLTQLKDQVEAIMEDGLGWHEEDGFLTGVDSTAQRIVDLLSHGPGPDGETPSERHNRLTRAAIFNIAGPILKGGGGSADMLVAGESIIVGLALTAIKLGGDEQVLDLMFEGARKRLAEMRLGDITPGGTA